MNWIIRALVAVASGLAGAIGPFLLYGRARTQIARLEAQVKQADIDLKASREALETATGLIQDQNRGIQRLKAESLWLESRIQRAKEQAASIQARNGMYLQTLKLAHVPDNAQGAMDWQRSELLKIARDME